MAKDLMLDPKTRDLKWPLQYITGKAEIQQALETLLLTPKGTFLDHPDIGIDTTYIDKYFNPDELRLAINNCLKEDKRVTSVNKIDIQPNKNYTTYRVFINVSTTLGNISFKKEMRSHAAK